MDPQLIYDASVLVDFLPDGSMIARLVISDSDPILIKEGATHNITEGREHDEAVSMVKWLREEYFVDAAPAE